LTFPRKKKKVAHNITKTTTIISVFTLPSAAESTGMFTN